MGHGRYPRQLLDLSPYQLERGRTAGALPRVTRHGLGRGRGTYAEEPDEDTDQKALVLARTSRQGSPRPGGHVIERLAAGVPVNETEVRRAFARELDRFAEMMAADAAADDDGWQARHDIAVRASREKLLTNWTNLVDSLDGQAIERLQPSRARRRAGILGLIQAVGGSEDALADDLIEFLGLAGLGEDELEELRSAQRLAELRGEDRWTLVVADMSMSNLRRCLADASIESLQRATAVVLQVSALTAIVVLFGGAQMAGADIDLPDRLRRYDAGMLRQLRADPAWGWAQTLMPVIRPRQRIRSVAMAAIYLLVIPGLLQLREADRDRLMSLVG